MYRLRRQVSEITPEARNLLRGTNYARKSLNDLIHLSKQKHDVQKRVGQLAKQDPDQQLRFHIDTAKDRTIHRSREVTASRRIKGKVGSSIINKTI